MYFFAAICRTLTFKDLDRLYSANRYLLLLNLKELSNI